MKKILYRSLILAGMGLAITSCKKETLVPATEDPVAVIEALSFSNAIEVEDGALVFENEQHLNKTLEDLSLMTPMERIEFEDQLGFRSQGSILFMVNEAENAHQEAFFKGLDPDLEVAELEAMGYNYKPTTMYSEYLEKGILKEIIHADNSRSFELAIDNPHLENAVNEEGVVIVGDTKITLEGTLVKEYSLSTGQLLGQHAAHKVNLNGEYDFQKNARRPGHEVQSGNKWWIYDPGQNSNYRYYAQAYFHSSYTTQLLAQTYYWIARAEQKKWGNWATRNDYTPIWGISAAWAYDYWVKYKGITAPQKHTNTFNPLPNTYNRPTSPYNLSNLHTNYTVRYMYPHGTFTISLGAFWENLRIFNHSYVFKFSGGPSGYNYTGQ